MGLWPFSKDKNGETDKDNKRPSDSKFKQQKLPAWQPILTASTVLPLFFFIGIVFLPIGIGLLVSSNQVQEIVLDYTNCKNITNGAPCETGLEASFKAGLPSGCRCNKTFDLPTSWNEDVYFYYGLSNFYQNHRRYVRSRDDGQLHGELSTKPISTCAPYDTIDNNGTKVPVAPCGAIANSMFNDGFKLYYTKQGGDLEVKWTWKDIAWKSDRDAKFKNPAIPTNGTLKDAFNGFAKPLYWMKNIWELDTQNPENNGFLNQDFIVWMRVSAFPTFRKLYRKHEKTAGVFKLGMPDGSYRLDIDYNYPVHSFEGEKRFILTTSSWIGGKNNFLGVAYIVVGCITLIFGFVFLVIHMKVRTRPQNE